ncbi:hypothetical protein RRG08_066620 [Elysia crispata]|uniref:Uncharacterized protein n=1 Tax=Elysia crispata TaxID=231223 RepID=A0AAE0YZR8_9GAST|nr:hypothetical protein RRG08_066620 [Elysia crispata]
MNAYVTAKRVSPQFTARCFRPREATTVMQGGADPKSLRKSAHIMAAHPALPLYACVSLAKAITQVMTTLWPPLNVSLIARSSAFSRLYRGLSPRLRADIE